MSIHKPDHDKYEKLLRARFEYVRSLQTAAENIEQIYGKGNESELEVVSASYFQWLIEKFDGFWFSGAEVEAHIQNTWSESTCFSPLDFELLVKHILFLVDGDRYLLTKKSHDEGVDLIFEEIVDRNHSTYARKIVQCKLYRGYVPVSEIRDFFGVMTARVAEGLFITTGRLTSQALQFLPLANESPHANRLHVVAGEDFRRLIEDVRKLKSLILESDIDPEDEVSFSAWFDEIESARADAQKQLWLRQPIITQKSLF